MHAFSGDFVLNSQNKGKKLSNKKRTKVNPVFLCMSNFDKKKVPFFIKYLLLLINLIRRPSHLATGSGQLFSKFGLIKARFCVANFDRTFYNLVLRLFFSPIFSL